MVANTIAENRRRKLDPTRNVWLFGYGSLVFKVGFPYLERRAATIDGWARRFWQGSHDHRGTPEAPGRVVTLVRREGAVCAGVAYLVSPEVFEGLDVREKNGYLRVSEVIRFADGSHAQALMYVATEQNEAFLGPASAQAIARHIAAARGPSGCNSEYVMSLARALRQLGAVDEHVAAIERHLQEIGH